MMCVISSLRRMTDLTLGHVEKSGQILILRGYGLMQDVQVTLLLFCVQVASLTPSKLTVSFSICNLFAIRMQILCGFYVLIFHILPRIQSKSASAVDSHRIICTPLPLSPLL